jgi:hypothetical protein
MNFLVVNRPSNLIIGTVCSSYFPEDTALKLFVEVNGKSLDAYFKWNKKNPDLLPDLGELLARSKHLNDQFACKLSKPIKVNTAQRYRESSQVHHTFDDLSVERDKLFKDYIRKHPDVSFYDLSDVFNCGTSTAKAYLLKYRE